MALSFRKVLVRNGFWSLCNVLCSSVRDASLLLARFIVLAEGLFVPFSGGAEEVNGGRCSSGGAASALLSAQPAKQTLPAGVRLSRCTLAARSAILATLASLTVRRCSGSKSLQTVFMSL